MKKYAYIAISVFLLAVIAAECLWGRRTADTFSASGKEKPIYSVDTDEKKIAISFDAAWGADNTKKLLDILDSYKVHATFFLVGFWIEKYPDMVKEIDARGYEIGNHSQNHPQMSKLSKEQMICEVQAVNSKICELTGKTPVVFRPPFGDYNDTLVLTLREQGMHAVQWSIDSLDWKEYGRQELIDRVLKKVENGDIILFHNNAKYTPEALPYILEQILAQGFEICSVGELIEKDDYYVDIQGIQHKNG